MICVFVSRKSVYLSKICHLPLCTRTEVSAANNARLDQSLTVWSMTLFSFDAHSTKRQLVLSQKTSTLTGLLSGDTQSVMVMMSKFSTLEYRPGK